MLPRAIRGNEAYAAEQQSADEILARLNRQTTSATEHWGDQRTIWPEGFDPRAAGFTFVDSYRGNLALQD